MSACPICGKEVDSLRAPAVGVRDGKVIAYCSKEHAALAESGPAKLIPTKIVRLPSEPSLKLLTPVSGVPTGMTPSLDSGPVIEISREPLKPVVESRKPKRADSSVQIADTGTIDDYVTPDRPRRGLWIAVAVLVLAGGAAAAYFLGAFVPRTSKSPVEPPPVTTRVAAVDAAPAVKLVTKDEAIARAKDTLRGYLNAESPRVQRLAAAALSRSGDKGAIDALVAALATEPSEVGKTELAYYIARAGDKRGIDALIAAASPTKRETKHEAGRRLAMLGDPRAVKVLEGSLTYPQFRLGVAEALAFLREPRALDILTHTLADTAALPEEKSRAAIALAWAGQADVAPALRDLIKSDRDRALAAHALANLHDEAARPELEAQLTVPSLRVRAARALRLLAPSRDTSPYVQQLVNAVASEKDTDQIDAAEALLLLAGPADWSTDE